MQAGDGTRTFFALVEEADLPGTRDGDWVFVDGIAEDTWRAISRRPAPRVRVPALGSDKWDLLTLLTRLSKLRDRFRTSFVDRAVWYRLIVARSPLPGDVDAEVVLLGDTEGPPPKVVIRDIERAAEHVARELADWAMLRSEPPSVRRFIAGAMDLALLRTGGFAVAAYDVGQGNCNAIVDADEHPRVFFDFGWPPNFHADTRPARRPNLLACEAARPAPVLLSHWDMDHWAYAVRTSHYDPRSISSRPLWNEAALRRFWIARRPRKEAHQLGPLNMSLFAALGANELLPGLPAVQLWPEGATRIRFKRGWIEACSPRKGMPDDRNNSGLALFVCDKAGHLVLLPGDADFGSVPSLRGKRRLPLVGMVASHHGSRIERAFVPRPLKDSPATLVYSVGTGNRYGHPKASARAAYTAKRWVEGWTSNRAPCVHAHDPHVHGNRLIPFPDTPAPHCGCGRARAGELCLSPLYGPPPAQPPAAANAVVTAAAPAALRRAGSATRRPAR